MKLSWIKLACIAFVCVLKTMREGEKSHPGDEWNHSQKRVILHLHHASLHLHSSIMGDKSEDHIAHALTRCAMIKYLEEKHGN